MDDRIGDCSAIGDSLPRFSIVIPTRGRASQLAACLRGIARLDYPRDRLEVIVVDDGSDEPPIADVAEAARTMDVMLVERKENGGPGAARNSGIAQASGEYIAFLGDDCEPAPGWLQALVRRFAGCSECLIGGQIVNALPSNLFSTASDHLIGYLYSHYNRDPDRAQFFTPNNMAAPRTRFIESGGFESGWGLTGEDRELCDRWLHRGGRLAYAHEAVVRHTHPLGLVSFWQQQVRYGRGTYKYRRRQRQPREGRIAPEPVSFYVNLVRFPLTRETGARAWALAALLALSQAANAAGFLVEAARESASGERVRR